MSPRLRQDARGRRDARIRCARVPRRHVAWAHAAALRPGVSRRAHTPRARAKTPSGAAGPSWRSRPPRRWTARAAERPRWCLVCRVFNGLLESESSGRGRGSSRNGALHLQNLAMKANWPGPLKVAAKKFANEFVASCRVSELADGFKGMSTLHNMSKWVRKERFGLPEYLLRTCPSSLREGRRLKTKFRLGCHDLRSSSC